MKPILVLLLALAPLACDDSATAPPTEPLSSLSQEYLFEVGYANFAWGFTMKGVFVDRRGNVYEYDHSFEPWKPERSDGFTAEELRDKFQVRERVDHIELSVLREMASLIDPAQEGKLSERVNRCYDAGGVQYLAYEYDPVRDLYTPILLYEAGDWASQNLSEAARELREWLFTLSGGRPAACTP
jgi:hypothetical protein